MQYFIISDSLEFNCCLTVIKLPNYFNSKVHWSVVFWTPSLQIRSRSCSEWNLFEHKRSMNKNLSCHESLILPMFCRIRKKIWGYVVFHFNSIALRSTSEWMIPLIPTKVLFVSLILSLRNDFLSVSLVLLISLWNLFVLSEVSNGETCLRINQNGILV